MKRTVVGVHCYGQFGFAPKAIPLGPLDLLSFITIKHMHPLSGKRFNIACSTVFNERIIDTHIHDDVSRSLGSQLPRLVAAPLIR